MLGTRVARRVLFLFMTAAAVPVAVLALLSFSAISGELRRQGEDRLHQFAGVATQSILERFASFAAILQSTAQMMYALTDVPGAAVPPTTLLPPGVEGLALDLGDGAVPVLGAALDLSSLSTETEARLAQGRPTLVLDRPSRGGPPRVLMGTPFVTARGTHATLWAQIVGDSIWAPVVTQATDPAISDLCVLDSSAIPLFCTEGDRSVLVGHIEPPDQRGSIAGQLEIEDRDGLHLVAWREVHLRPSFGAPSWTVAVGQPASAVYEAGAAFTYNLLLAILVGLSAALLVTHVLVRRTMQPLRELTDGTRRLAERDLTARVPVRSRDEFGDLSASFNDMAEQLGLQFRQLEARRAIDHAALTASDDTDAVRAVLDGIGSVTSCGKRALVISEPALPGTVSVFTPDGGDGSVDRIIRVSNGSSAAPALDGALARGAALVVQRREDVPDVLRPLLDQGADLPLLILPLRIRGRAVGAVAVASEGGRPFTAAVVARAQELTDQGAVAFEKLRLDREIFSMSWEALRALANAIDAKSTWTTGHSQRVTALSLVLGSDLGLDEEEMVTVHRGGLLHDVGKIAVPSEVLDFAGALTPEMRAVMERHPQEGVRILEPIRAFEPILPIVLYHHERWNGSGYPEGLREDRIPWLARVVAVADVFDAMVSARPYRPALTPESVLAHVRSRAEMDFDPAVVRALENVMKRGWRPEDAVTGLSPTLP